MENKGEVDERNEGNNRRVEEQNRGLGNGIGSANERLEERRRLFRTPDNWWFIQRFCCCSTIRTACQIIIYWDVACYFIVSLQCLWICSQHGGYLTHPGSTLKYFIIFRYLLYLLRVIPQISAVFSGLTKPALKFVFLPRLISVLGITLLFIIMTILSNNYFRSEDGFYFSIEIYTIPVILFDLYAQIAIKSSSVTPPEQFELPPIIIPAQPNFIIAQPANMQIPVGQPVPQQNQNYPQQNNNFQTTAEPMKQVYQQQEFNSMK